MAYNLGGGAYGRALSGIGQNLGQGMQNISSLFANASVVVINTYKSFSWLPNETKRSIILKNVNFG